MKKMHKLPFNLDEREMNDFRNICTIMYIITLFALMSIQLYRQFVLNQPQQEWNDIAMLMTINVIVLLGAVLYLTGAVNPKKIRRSYLIAGYVGFVLLGFAFTVFKYTVILGQQIGLVQIWDYLLTVILISGVLAFALGILAYLGSRRIDKQIE
jgi:heme/copper-type cytochrome/quinol oxidase subunit 3